MKILWPVDPLAEDYLLQRSAALAVKALVRGRDAIIVPIYIWGAYVSGIPTEIPPDILPRLSNAGQEAMDDILEPTGLEYVAPLRIIVRQSYSIRDAVERVVKLAKHWKADLVVASSHARKGLSRVFLGSFAETLMMKSDVPLLLVNPKWTNGGALFKNVLFPTDFSEESLLAFEQVIPFAKSMGAKLLILNKMQLIFPPSYGPAFTAYPAFESFFEKDLDARREIISEWVKKAKVEGVAAESLIDPNMGGTTVESIIRVAKKNPGLIAMASHSGPLKASLLGSVTRELLRQSPVPVWVVHPQPRAVARRRAA